jgi:hypothetical protein
MSCSKCLFLFQSILFCMMMFTLPGLASTHMPSSNEIVYKMQKDLSMTKAQTEKIRPIIENSVMQIKQIAESEKISSEEACEMLIRIQRSTKQKLSLYLTEQQMRKLLNTQ